MRDYRRIKEPGETCFFTMVTFERQSILTSPEACEFLRFAWKDVQSWHPFETIEVFSWSGFHKYLNAAIYQLNLGGDEINCLQLDFENVQ
jgi:hypothetical protein